MADLPKIVVKGTFLKFSLHVAEDEPKILQNLIKSLH